MGIKETFKKQGGSKLIKQYLRSGVFFTAFFQFLLLGKSRTSLEILRLSVTQKTKRKLAKKYKRTLAEFDNNYSENEHLSSNRIWICWFQGMDNAPYIVKKCYNSVQENFPDKEIVVITSDNFTDYVDFPDYILDKWRAGMITHTHMTDLLRLELLIKYGGMWLDATVFCSDSKVPEYFFDSDLFFFQTLKPGRDGHASYISSWLMSAKTNNRVLMATRSLLYAYWKKNKKMTDYFLLHDFFAIVLDHYPKDWRNVIPRDNAAPHVLLLRLFDEYDEGLWNAVREQTQFHKLTYKFTEADVARDDTFYSFIFK